MKKPAFSRRKFIKHAGLIGAGALAGPAFGRQSEQGSRHPNILFLLTDDQRSDTLGCMGNKILGTPSIDWLAENGVTFNNAFVTTSICPVNRACIFTGQHARTHGIQDFHDSFSQEAYHQTYPSLMAQSGYRTGFIGKFGVGNTDEDIEIARNQFEFWRGFPGQGEFFQEIDGKKVHSTHMMADQAIDFLGTSSKNQPWCLSLSFKAPHQPREQHGPELAELYADREIPLAPNASQEVERVLTEFICDSLSGLDTEARTEALTSTLRG